MNLLCLILMGLFFTGASFAATISKVKISSKQLVLNLNRKELKSITKGAGIKFKVEGLPQIYKGNVTSKRRKEVKVSLKGTLDNVIDLKKGDKVSIVDADPRSDKSKRSSKRKPYEISYKAKGSERERLKKDFSLDFEGGVASGPTVAAGVTLGTYVSHNTIFELNYSQGTSTAANEDSEFFPVQETLDAKVAVFRFKNFFGNSFYTNTGIGARMNTKVGIAELESPDGSGAIQAPVYAQSFADAIFEFAIGNKWQLSYFNVGFDWISLTTPLSKIRLADDGNALPQETLAQATANVPGATQFLAAAQDLTPSNIGTVFLTKFYIGLAF